MKQEASGSSEVYVGKIIPINSLYSLDTEHTQLVTTEFKYNVYNQKIRGESSISVCVFKNCNGYILHPSFDHCPEFDPRTWHNGRSTSGLLVCHTSADMSLGYTCFVVSACYFNDCTRHIKNLNLLTFGMMNFFLVMLDTSKKASIKTRG